MLRRIRRKLRGMVVVITGASAGIGQALAEALASRGAMLVLSARRIDRLEQLNRSLGGGHLVIHADIARTDDCERIIRQAWERFGRIDTLVCNAGHGLLRPVAQMADDELWGMLQTNLFGTLDCIRPAVPLMAGQAERSGWRGQIMIVSSAAARRGLPYFGGYSATKAAQLSLAEALRVELRDQRIAVTSVHPIGTDTEFGEAARRAGQTQKRIAPSPGEVRQTAADVASAMLRAIERPRPEVWPFRPSRWVLSFATLIPGWVDRLMAKRMVIEEIAREGDA